MHKINIIFRWIMLSKLCLPDQLKNSYMELLMRSGANIQISIKKNDPFESNDFIWNSKDISHGNCHLWHQKSSLPSTKVLGFVAFRVTSKILGIWSAERSWGDVKKNQDIYQLLAVTFLRSRVFCIHLPVLKKQGMEGLYLT